MTNHEKTTGAELTGQAIPDVAETEPRLTVGQARERLNTQLHCMADEIRAWGTVVDATVDAAIDALIAAVRAEQPVWQSISTAPKDGTRILGVRIWSDGSARYEVLRHEDRHWTDGEYTYDPTHWLPLPAPPSEET